MIKDKTTVYIKRSARRDVEQLLRDTVGQKFGKRFNTYREQYANSVDGSEIPTVPEYPVTLSIEMVNRCNLACVMCHLPHFLKEKATLTLENLEKVFSEGEQLGVPAVIFGNGHEPLLYKEFDTMVDSAVSHKFMDLLLYTNGHLLTQKQADKILNSSITRVFVSIDAATEETYNRIRQARTKAAVGTGRLELVEKNLHYLIRRREELGLKLPIVRVSFVVQKENQHEVDMFRERWIDVVDSVDFQVESSHRGIETMELLDEAERWKGRELGEPLKRMAPRARTCHYPFDTLSIWSDGKVGPCCTYMGKNLVVGNIHEQTLQEIWHGDKIKLLRQQFLDGKPNIVCQDCLARADFESLPGSLVGNK